MKLALTGAHGVGKTTLLNYLSQNLDLDFRVTPEVPRIITNSLNDNEFFRRGNNSLLKQSMILYGQIIVENINEGELTICDRTVLDHWAYTRYLFKSEFPEYLEKVFYELTSEHIKTYDHVFYIPIEFEVEDDGTREGDLAFQKAIDEEIRKLLNEYKVNYSEIRGTVENRFNKLIEKIIRNEK